MLEERVGVRQWRVAARVLASRLQRTDLTPSGRPSNSPFYSAPVMFPPGVLVPRGSGAILNAPAMSTVPQIASRPSLESLFSACSPPARSAFELVLSGRELSFEDALLLAQTVGEEFSALVSLADHLRRETVGDTITYVVNRNINFTNVCFVGCSFCGFARGPQAADAYSMSTTEVVRRAEEAWQRGATEVCIQGGLPRDLDGFFYRDLLRAIKRAIPQMQVHAFSPMEISYGADKTRMPLRDYLQMMKDEGLGSIPGTAAEILDDRVRRELSPNKLPVARWVEIITTAHELGIPTTSTMMYGHVEEPADWIRHLLLLRGIQKRTGGFTEFVPLGFVHEKTRLFRQGGARPGAQRDEHLRVHALSRVLLQGAINNIQVSWVKLGFETSLACLNAGANDFSGTLMEESISKAAGANFGEYVSPDEFQSMIRSIGRTPAERTTTYKIRRKYDDSAAAQPIPARLQLASADRHSPYAEGAY